MNERRAPGGFEGDPGRGFRAVVKMGGSLARDPQAVQILMELLARAAARARILVVPGGGPFADAVRDAYRRHAPGEEAAHRMALLAMDQYGVLLADRVAAAAAVTSLAEARRVAAGGRLPVLLPAALLWAADPLENSWQVTSDSLAAWLAGTAGAALLVLVKSAGGPGPVVTAREAARAGIVDPAFPAAIPPHASTWLVDGHRPEELENLLAGRHAAATRVVSGAREEDLPDL